MSTNFDSVPDTHFGLVCEHQGDKARFFPLRNATETKTAAAYLATNKTEFPLSDRQSIAARILTRADETGVELDTECLEDLRKQAGFGECTSADVRDLLRTREGLLRKECAPVLQALSKTAAETVLPREVRLKLAAAIDELDRESGLHLQYGERLQRPENVLFGLTPHVIKTALETHIQLADGAVYDKTALHAVTEPALREWLGDSVTDGVCDLQGVDLVKLSEVLPTLPAGDARRFGQLAKSAGVTRVA